MGSDEGVRFLLTGPPFWGQQRILWRHWVERKSTAPRMLLKLGIRRHSGVKLCRCSFFCFSFVVVV